MHIRAAWRVCGIVPFTRLDLYSVAIHCIVCIMCLECV